VLSYAWCQNAVADNWEWGSAFGLSSNWNDNATLSAFNAISTFRWLITYNGEFSRLSPNSVLSFRPRITQDFYPDKDKKDLQSLDFFLPGSYRLSRQRTSWNLGYNLSRQSVLSDETTLDNGGINQLNADDQVYRASLSPNLSWNVSLKDQLLLGFSVNATEYTLKDTNRADSLAGGLNTSYLRNITERQTVGFTASYFEYKSDNTRLVLLDNPPNPPAVIEIEVINKSNSSTLTLDYSLKTSITSSLNVSFGLQNSEVTNTVSETSTGQVISEATTPFKSTTYNISFRKALEQGGFNINLGRSVSPAANGQPQDNYRITLSGDAKLTEKLTGKLVLRASQQEAIVLAATDGAFSRKNRNYNADLSLSWAYTRKWSISANYRFRFADRDAGLNSSATTAQSNSVSLGINYKWKAFRS
jgi:hypothetical protein